MYTCIERKDYIKYIIEAESLSYFHLGDPAFEQFHESTKIVSPDTWTSLKLNDNQHFFSAEILCLRIQLIS